MKDSHKSCRTLASMKLVLALPLVMASSAWASQWTGGAGNSFYDDALNWSNGVPAYDNFKQALFDPGATVQFRSNGGAYDLHSAGFTSFLLNGHSFRVDTASIWSGGTLSVRGGAASFQSIHLEGGAGLGGSELIGTGAGTQVTFGGLTGGGGYQAVRFSEGSVFRGNNLNLLTGYGGVHFQSGATGVFETLNLGDQHTLVLSGPGTGVEVSNSFSIDRSIAVSNGATFSSLSYSAVSSVTHLSISGAGSQFRGNFALHGIGSVTDGGSLSTYSTGTIGFFSETRLTVAGAGSQVNAARLDGANRQGKLIIADGGKVSVGQSTVREISVSGQGSSFEASSNTNVTDLALSDGASFKAYNLGIEGASSIRDASVVANNVTTKGTLNIRDSTLIDNSSNAGRGTFSNIAEGVLIGSFRSNHRLNNSARISIAAGDSMEFLSGINNRIGTIGSDGSLLFQEEFENKGEMVISGSLRAELLISNTGDIEINGDLGISGGDFINAKAGRMIIFNESTTGFMDDVVNDGEIVVAEGSKVVFNGSYSGIGTISGTGTTVMLGDLRPGHSPGEQTIEGELIFGEDFTYSVELGGTLQGREYDVTHVGGTLSLGGTLSVSLIDGFTVSAGDQFEILTFGALEGEFTAFEGLLFDDGVYFDLIWGENNLTLVAIPEPGTMLLLLPGLLGLGWMQRRNRARK